jgi:hypothetical protein
MKKTLWITALVVAWVVLVIAAIMMGSASAQTLYAPATLALSCNAVTISGSYLSSGFMALVNMIGR